MHRLRTRRESPSCSDEFPAGHLCDLGKGTPHLFSSPISFAYLSSSLTVCNGVPPVWPPVVAAEQTPASSLQPFAFIFILFVFTFRKMCPTDAQKCVLLAGHQCDDCQWTGQRRKVALLIMCKLGTNLAPQNAALPRRSRGHLATPPAGGVYYVACAKTQEQRDFVESNCKPLSDLRLCCMQVQRDTLYLQNSNATEFHPLTPIYSSLRTWVRWKHFRRTGQSKVSINALNPCNNKESISEPIANRYASPFF